ncbi:MAG TPA: hypothetical protein GX510_09020 [Firmicutes bacterium]|nr:hypothetical protein [Candidatus Fermentithermobacillaceae bacterium]
MSGQDRKYMTQWSAQFFAAAELARRGYLVSLTLGNAPSADLIVQSPKGTRFTVDVKGQATKNFWLIQKREANPAAHFFILVYLPKSYDPPWYFIVPSDELMKKREEYARKIISRGRPYRDDLGGINWSTAHEYRDKWDCLPP